MTHRMPRKNRHEKNVPKHKKCSGTFSFIVREILIYLATSHRAKPLHMGDRWVTDSPKWAGNKKEDTGVAHVSS